MMMADASAFSVACRCGAPAVVVVVGTEPVHELFLLKRGVRDRHYCWACWAKEFGRP